jgi:predicted PurR-regulated permease PerM
MAVLALFTALGLWLLQVPYWLAFGIFTGLVALVPFFGTLVSTVLPALFVVGTGDWLRVFLVLLLGVLVHMFEANVVVPRIMERQVRLPPVLTISSVLIMATLLGAIGLVVAVPILALTMVFVRHVVQGEVYGDAQGVQPAVLRSVGERRVRERRALKVDTSGA